MSPFEAAAIAGTEKIYGHGADDGVHPWYAAGHSYKWIAAELNRQGQRSSRGGTWAVSAIKVILENEMYEGRA